MTPVVLLGSLALLTAQTTAPPPQASALASPAAAVATPSAEAAPDPQAVADNLADMYDKSCGGRIFGMYAEACNNLAAQLRKAQDAARKAQRTAAAKH